MRTIGYVRVSTDKQAEHGVSLEAQEAKIRAMAIVHGADLPEMIVDGGESAKSLQRPGMQRLLALVDAKKVFPMGEHERAGASQTDRRSSRFSGRQIVGTGIATEAAGRLLRHAFEVLRLNSAMAVIIADNTASRRVLEKLGMRTIENPESAEWNLQYFRIDAPMSAEVEFF